MMSRGNLALFLLFALLWAQASEAFHVGDYVSASRRAQFHLVSPSLKKGRQGSVRQGSVDAAGCVTGLCLRRSNAPNGTT
jgi:hypothetical protein